MAQTMTLAELLALRIGQGTVGYYVHANKVNVSGEFHKQLRARMAETGECAVPVCVIGDRLRDGQHRVALAFELGLAGPPVTDELAESGFYRQRELLLAGRVPERLQAPGQVGSYRPGADAHFLGCLLLGQARLLAQHEGLALPEREAQQGLLVASQQPGKLIPGQPSA